MGNESDYEGHKIVGWALVLFGLAVAVYGFIGMSFYSPGLTEEALYRISVGGGLILLDGILMIWLGWLILRERKRLASAAKAATQTAGD